MVYLFAALSLILSSSLTANEEIVRTYQYNNSYPDSPYQKSQQKEEEFLFIFHAKDGHLQSMDRGSYELTLYNADKNVTYFTDRPNRKAGKISISQFLREWDMGMDSLRQDNPNAGLVSFSKPFGKDQFDDIPVILSDPHYEQQHDRLTFQVKLLEKHQKIPTGDLGETTLFIDMAQQFTGLPMGD